MVRYDPEIRFLRGWSKAELKDRLKILSARTRNFESLEVPPWKLFDIENVIHPESFEQAKVAVASYEFSDPGIVRAHFDPDSPLLGRRMLLEIQVLGLHFLCGTVVGEVLEIDNSLESLFGYRYDTLEGHVESGAEWFILLKNKETGEITFHIQGQWRPGRLPTWWSKVGFRLLVRRYQRTWHRRAFRRLSESPKGAPLSLAIGLGVVAGMRSLSAPAVLAHAGRFRHERGWEALAFLEMVADKLAFVPSRIGPIPLLARAASGAMSARRASVPDEKRRILTSMALGGASAIVSAFGAYHLRRTAVKKLRVSDSFLGLIEDAVVLSIGAILTRWQSQGGTGDNLARRKFRKT